RDPTAGAKLLAALLDVPWRAAQDGPFTPVFVNDGLTVDFAEGEKFDYHHYCFRVTETDFDAIHGRLQAAGIPYRSTPLGETDMRINRRLGGKDLYWNDADGHIWEILTVSYARASLWLTSGGPELTLPGALDIDHCQPPAVPLLRPHGGRDLRPGRAGAQRGLQRHRRGELRPGRVLDAGRDAGRGAALRRRPAPRGGVRGHGGGGDRGGRADGAAGDPAGPPRRRVQPHHRDHRGLDPHQGRGHGLPRQERGRPARLHRGAAVPHTRGDVRAPGALDPGRGRGDRAGAPPLLRPDAPRARDARGGHRPRGGASRGHRRAPCGHALLRAQRGGGGDRRAHRDPGDPHHLRRGHHARAQGLRGRGHRRPRQHLRRHRGRPGAGPARGLRRRAHRLGVQGRGGLPAPPAPALPPPARPVRARPERAGVSAHLDPRARVRARHGDLMLTRRQFTTTMGGAIAAGLLAPGAVRAQGAPIKLGSIFSYAGPAAFLVDRMKRSVELFVEEANKKGGLNGRRIELTLYDAGSESTKAVLAAKRLIEQDGVEAIVGDGNRSDIGLALVPSVQRAEVPLMSVSGATALVEPVKERAWVFKSTVNDVEVVARLLDF